MRLEMLKKKKKSHVSKHRQPAGHHERNIEKKVVGFSTEALGDLLFFFAWNFACWQINMWKTPVAWVLALFSPLAFVDVPRSLGEDGGAVAEQEHLYQPWRRLKKKKEEEKVPAEFPPGDNARETVANSEDKRLKLAKFKFSIFFSAPRSISCSLYCPVATGK